MPSAARMAHCLVVNPDGSRPKPNGVALRRRFSEALRTIDMVDGIGTDAARVFPTLAPVTVRVVLEFTCSMI